MVPDVHEAIVADEGDVRRCRGNEQSLIVSRVGRRALSGDLP
jgi:hypothetical protein